MNRERHQFEEYLRRFQPKAPRPWQPPSQRPNRPQRPWLVAAALFVAAVAGYAVRSVNQFWNRELTPERSVTSPAVPTVRATLGSLSRVAIGDPDALEKALVDTSPRLLLRVDRPGGPLASLAKE